MATTTIAARKLGKLPVRIDVRTLPLARYVDTAEAAAAARAIRLRRRTSHDWPMYANDRIGDCTIAAAGHMIEAWTAAARGTAVEIPESAVLTAFDAVKVVDPQTGEEGAVELDVLKYWRKTGIGGHRDRRVRPRVARTTSSSCAAATWLFGGLYLGLALPLTAQTQDTWDWTGSLVRPGRARLAGAAMRSTSSATTTRR